jgi:polyisoprenoid-binding protein YceI
MKSLYLLVPAMALLAACSKTPPAEQIPATPVAAAKVDVPPGAYTLDRAHASLTFRVSHLGFSRYTAQFKTFDAQLQFDPMNLAASSVTVTVDPRSLDLDNPPAGFVDELIGKNWLDSEQFPVMTFKSTKVDALTADKVHITGDFTLHGVTKPVVLEATFNGGYAGHPMDPHARIGFSASGTLKRSEFGIAYGIPEPGSTMGVSDEVSIAVEAEFSGPPLASAQTPAPQIEEKK